MTARYWQGINPLMSQTQAREVAALERAKATWQMTARNARRLPPTVSASPSASCARAGLRRWASGLG